MTWKPGDLVVTRHDREYYIDPDTGELVKNSRFETQERKDAGYDGDYPYPDPIPLEAKPAGGGNSKRIPERWWNKTRSINPPLIWRNENKKGGSLCWLNYGWANYKPNRNDYPDGGLLPDPPDPWPFVEALTSVYNIHRVVERRNGATRIEAYRYSDPVPDVLDPYKVCTFRSIAIDGTIADMGSKFPLLVANEAWIPDEKLKLYVEEKPMKPLTRDYSRYQGIVDFDVATTNGVLMMIARAGISWGYQDSWFPANWANAEGKMYRSSYHVIYLGEDIVRQADNWYSVHPTLDVIPRVIDMELDHGVSNSGKADAMRLMSDLVLARDGHRPIIYSRRLLIDQWLAAWSDEFKNEHYWWLAQYLNSGEEHLGPPTLPNGVLRENVILHQTSDKLAGFPGEVQSAAVDYNRWQLGDEAQMVAFIASEWDDETLPQPPPTTDRNAILTEAQAAIEGIKT